MFVSLVFRAEKIEHGKAYASIMVCEQETMLAQLRHTRRQMEKDEKQLKEMQDYLFRKQMPRKWTPYSTSGEKQPEREEY